MIIVKMDENSGTSQMQSVNRKIEYKRLLEVGGHIAENAEISSTAEIVSAVEDLVTKTNVLYNQGKDQAPEALLDAQVKFAYTLFKLQCYIEFKFNLGSQIGQ